MNCYFDSSALVKRYVAEAGRETVDALIEKCRIGAVSRLAYVEVLAALYRRRATMPVDDAGFAAGVAAFREDWRGFAVAEMTGTALEQVERVIERHRLRGADSIHLATALWLRRLALADLVMVAADSELLAAARKEGLAVIDPLACAPVEIEKHLASQRKHR